MVLLYGCILAEDGGWCAMMIIVNHPLPRLVGVADGDVGIGVW